MFKIISRIKTDGSYNKCAKMDELFTSYGNKIELQDFNTKDGALEYILKNGEKNRVYYIVQEYLESYDKLNIGNDFFDVGNNFYVREKYCFNNNKLIRLCITNSLPYNLNKSKRKFY